MYLLKINVTQTISSQSTKKKMQAQSISIILEFLFKTQVIWTVLIKTLKNIIQVINKKY